MPSEVRISLVYLIAGAIWITTSDAIVFGLFGRNPLLLEIVQSVKGIGFVGFTAFLLFVLLRREFLKQRHQMAQIAEQEEKFHHFFVNHPQPMWVYDLETQVFLDVNDAALAHYGYNRPEFMGLTLKNICSPEELPRLEENLRQPAIFLENRRCWQQRRKNGSLFSVEIASHHILYEGHPAVWVQLEDVTEQQQAETALIESEQRLNSILANLDAVVWSQAMPSEELIYMSAAMEKLYGYPADITQPPPLLWKNIIHKDDYTRVVEAYEQIKRSGFARLDYRILHQDGSVRWMYARGWLVHDKDDKPIRLDGIISDITARKQAEMQLTAHEERLNSILNNIEDMVWSAEYGTGYPIYVNQAVQSVYGVSPEKFIQQPQLWMDMIHPDDLPVFLESNVIAMEKGFRTIDYRIIRPDKQIRRVRDRLHMVVDDDGNVLRLDGIITDLSTIDEIEKRQRETERLQAALQKESEQRVIRNQFISMISHDFRNPLAVISSSTDILMRYEQLEPEKRDALLKKIKLQVNRMVALLEDILMLSRTEAVGIDLLAEPVDIVALCQELVEDARQNIGNYHQIIFESNAPQVMLEGDVKLLRRAISNLVSNAIKYTPQNGDVFISLAATHNIVTIAITDTGIGIPPKDMPRLFDAFRRAENVGNIPGTGLGLAIAKQVVELHNGQITVSSQLGKGTEFLITLPLTRNRERVT